MLRLCGERFETRKFDLDSSISETSLSLYDKLPFRSLVMAPEQKKRKRPVPTSSQRSKKRQRVQPVESTNISKDVKRLPVALDALPWNEVEMPDMFEDAEGFYGLEEVEDVEVVRDGNRVQFVSTSQG